MGAGDSPDVVCGIAHLADFPGPLRAVRDLYPAGSAGGGRRGRAPALKPLDVYMPLVDDHESDCVIKREEIMFIDVQIKARSSEVTDGSAALFSAITHALTENFYFVCDSGR